MSQSLTPSVNLLLRRAVAAGILGVALAACGGNNDPAVQTGSSQSDNVAKASMSVTITAKGAPTTKAVGDNLISLSGSWPTWAGEDSGIVYDAAANVLRIPGDGSDIVLGVQRFETPLTQGTEYTMSVESSNEFAAAVIFLFDSNGAIVPLAVDGGSALSVARLGSSITFSAPADIAGFYLQIQNSYQATTEAELTAALIEDESEPTTGPSGENLIELEGQWPDWADNDTGITYDADAGLLMIPAPTGDSGNAIGARRFEKPLMAGAEYEFAVDSASGPGVSALLFLFDTNGQLIPFAGPAFQMPWLSANSETSRRFVSPTGVVGFAIQVQSPYQATEQSAIAPSLKAVNGGTGSVSVVTTSGDGGFVIFDNVTRQWIDNACLDLLAAADFSVPVVPWDDISALTQLPGIGDCDAVLAALTAPSPAQPADGVEMPVEDAPLAEDAPPADDTPPADGDQPFEDLVPPAQT